MNEAEREHREWGRLYDDLAARLGSEVCASSRYDVISRAVVKRIEEDVGRKLCLGANDRLLDLGCGTGLISIGLSKRVSSITGMDLGRDVLRRARRNFRAAGREGWFVRGDIAHLPFKSEAFDKVLCYSVAMCLQSYDDFKNALGEMLRVCRPGGLVMVGDIPEKNKKADWIKGKRRPGEPLPSYLWRRARQGVIKFRYRVSARRFEQGKARLNIAPPRAAGMFYEAEKILAVCRELGVSGHILDQPPGLAFGNTRVDLLVEKE